MNKVYSFSKSIKDKEQKILNYYKRFSNIEQPNIVVIPKRNRTRSRTKKHINKFHLDITNKNAINDIENVDKKEIYKSLHNVSINEYGNVYKNNSENDNDNEHNNNNNTIRDTITKSKEHNLTKKNIVIMDD